jgi:outer membrane usher protein
MLERYGIAAEKLNPQLSQQAGYCGRLKEWRNEENVKDNLIQSSCGWKFPYRKSTKISA